MPTCLQVTQSTTQVANEGASPVSDTERQRAESFKQEPRARAPSDVKQTGAPKRNRAGSVAEAKRASTVYTGSSIDEEVSSAQCV